MGPRVIDDGIDECRRRGCAVVHVPGEGFRPCREDEPGAYVDLDRYAYWLSNSGASLDSSEPLEQENGV